MIELFLDSQNPAAGSLFRHLVAHSGSRQMIVCHSQGNLATSNALWGLQAAAGEAAFANLQVYSLASPAPAWPESLNYKIKVYGHSNDLVTWADIKRYLGARSPGDWRKWNGDRFIGLGGHPVNVNIFQTNFANRLRLDLCLQALPGLSVPG